MKFKVYDNGNMIECEIIMTFKDEKANISYIVYTDGTKDENGNLEIYASRYKIENNDYILDNIQNDYEWDLVDKKLDEMRNESK